MEKKIEPIEALAKIKVLIEKYFSDIGRNLINETDEVRIELIDNIDEILAKVNIPIKNILAEQLDLDDETDKE